MVRRLLVKYKPKEKQFDVYFIETYLSVCGDSHLTRQQNVVALHTWHFITFALGGMSFNKLLCLQKLS